jgi:tRNA threonylcarbamoyladenosine biosynthesis protein TsaB
MLILGIDTSGKSGSIALAQTDADEEFRVLEVVPLAGGTYSAQLIPQISALLTRHGYGKEAIGAFAVASGPGSFTGLRVGLSTVKALAEVLGKPIAPVSVLEAVAWSSNDLGRNIAAVDAGRKQVFLGEYQAERHGLRAIREWIASVDELVAMRRENAEIPLVTSDEPLVRALHANELTARLMPPPQADVIARLGAEKLRRGESVSPEALDANYIRRSDAELFSLPKLG